MAPRTIPGTNEVARREVSVAGSPQGASVQRKTLVGP